MACRARNPAARTCASIPQRLISCMVSAVSAVARGWLDRPGAAFQHQRRKARGSEVDRGGQAGRAGAHDQDRAVKEHHLGLH
jgi:hypothetical protein